MNCSGGFIDNEAWFVLQQCCWIGLLDRFWARFPRPHIAYTLPILRLWYERQFRLVSVIGFWALPSVTLLHLGKTSELALHSTSVTLPSVTLLHLGKTSELALHSTFVTLPYEDDGKEFPRCRQGLGKGMAYSSHTQTGLLSMATLCHHYANTMRTAAEGYGINCRIRLTRRNQRDSNGTPKEG